MRDRERRKARLARGAAESSGADVGGKRKQRSIGVGQGSDGDGSYLVNEDEDGDVCYASDRFEALCSQVKERFDGEINQ